MTVEPPCTGSPVNSPTGTAWTPGTCVKATAPTSSSSTRPDSTDPAVGYAEAPYPGAESVKRMVNRNDRAVTATVVGGQIVYADGSFPSGFGTTLRAGTFLRSTQAVRALAAPATRP